MKKILVIEDEPEMLRKITLLLRYKDYEPIAAENGRLGVEMVYRELPDLILCDVMMPELDGYGVLCSLQADAKLAAIPFIFLTGKSVRDEAERHGLYVLRLRNGMKLGTDDYLTKPIGNEELVDAIEARIHRSKQHSTGKV
jgi:DNA-binding response OmpR family regulator